MNALLSHFRCDFTNARRDSLLLYVIISPLILAVAVALFTPSMGGVALYIAVERAVLEQSGVTEKELGRYASVTVFDGPDDLEHRVMQDDGVAGIAFSEGSYEIVLQGNESGRTAALAAALIRSVFEAGKPEGGAGDASDAVVLDHEQLGAKRTYLREILTLMLVLLASLIGGMIAGFNIVEEKTNNITSAFAVAPTRAVSYLGAKAAVAGLLGLFVSSASILVVLGFRVPWGRLILTAAVSTMMAAAFGFILGRFAENQISALGLNKILMPVYLTAPLVSIFIPLKFHWFFAVFPQYWLFTAFWNLILPGMPAFTCFWISLAVFTGESAVVLFLVGRGMKKVIGIK